MIKKIYISIVVIAIQILFYNFSVYASDTEYSSYVDDYPYIYAQIGDIYADGDCITLELNESVSDDCISDLDNISVINADNNKLVETKISSYGRCVYIYYNEILNTDTEYIINIPDTIYSISGKFFEQNKYSFYAIQDKFIIREPFAYNDFENGINAGMNLSISQVNGADFEIVNLGGKHNNVLKYTSQGREYGGNPTIDISVNGDTEDEEYCYVSYDVMLAQENSFSFVTSIGNLENIFYRNVFNAKNNYVMLNMCAHPDRYTCMDLEANTSNAYVKKFEKDRWYTISLKIDKINRETMVYVDDTFVGKTKRWLNDGNNLLTNIKLYEFALKDNLSSKKGDVIYIDNIKVGRKEITEKVIKYELFDTDGNVYTSLSDNVSCEVNQIKIYFTENISMQNLNSYNIKLFDGKNYAKMTLMPYNATENSLICNLTEPLYSGTKYTISIKNLFNIYGKAIPDFERSFTTIGENNNPQNEIRSILEDYYCINDYLTMSGYLNLCKEGEEITIVAVKPGYELNENDDISPEIFFDKIEYFDQITTGINGKYNVVMKLKDAYGKYTINFYTQNYDNMIASFDYFRTDWNSQLKCNLLVPIGNVFFENDKFEIKLDIEGNKNNTSFYNIKGNVFEYKSQKILDSFDYDISSKELENNYMALPINESLMKFGVLGLDITVTDLTLNRYVNLSTKFSICNSNKAVQNEKMGFANHFQQYWKNSDNGSELGEELLMLERNAGSKLAREEILWHLFEKKAGIYKLYPELEEWMISAKEKNITPFLILGYTNDLYINDGGAPKTESELEAFENFSYQAVMATNQYTDMYEVYNEYNLISDAASYLNILKASYEGIKRAENELNKKITVYGVCAAYLEYDKQRMFSWIEDLLKLGGGQYMDAITIHPYTPKNSPENGDLVGIVTRVRDLLIKYGYDNMPIVFSEYGWCPDASIESEEIQAQYTVRGAALSYDIADKIIWYCGMDYKVYNDYEQRYGFVRHSRDEIPLNPKPAYLAVANFNTLMTNAIIKSKIIENDIYNYQFIDSYGDVIYMIWSSEKNDVLYNLNAGSKCVTVFDMYGNKEIITSNNGYHELVIGLSPIYVKINKFGTIHITDTEGNLLKNKSDIVSNSIAKVILELNTDEIDFENAILTVGIYKNNVLKNCITEKINDIDKNDKIYIADFSFEIEDSDSIKVFLWSDYNKVIPYVKHYTID